MLEFNNPVQYALPFFVLLVALEIYLTVRHDREHYPWKEAWASAQMGLGAVAIGSVAKIGTLAVFFLLYEGLADLRLGLLGYDYLGWVWWVWILAFLGDDFNFYWHHRFSHTVRVLWAAHVVHHSSEVYSLGTTSIRNGWLTLLYKPFFWLWLPLLGFHPVMVLTCMGVNSIYQFFLHSQRIPPLGVLEHIFNTPYLHQVHHARNYEYLDKNHGGILILWDKLFGTYQGHEPGVKPEFGVLSQPNSRNPLVIVSHEYVNIWRDVRQAPDWKSRLRYIFGAPGWRHDGPLTTAKVLTAQARANKLASPVPVAAPQRANA